jgi:peptidyl-prolyl cis-trans isomerase B (cyclophilin B)
MIKRSIIACLVLSVLFFAACSTPEGGARDGSAANTVASSTGVKVSTSVAEAEKGAPVVAPELTNYVKDVRIIMHTSKGEIEATLFATRTPVTVANFLNLTQRGYYNGLTFHRVIPNFMIQGGDPQGTGGGGPGYQFENEMHSALRHNRAGIFSMANAGPGTNGSQFFITHNETPWLDGKHSVFGQVTKGQKVVDAIRQGDTINSIDVLDSTNVLFAKQKQRIDQWNVALTAMGF